MGGGSRWGDLGCVGGLQPASMAMPAMLIGLNKMPQISFMAAFVTSLLSILDPRSRTPRGEHGDKPGVKRCAGQRVGSTALQSKVIKPLLYLGGGGGGYAIKVE